MVKLLADLKQFQTSIGVEIQIGLVCEDRAMDIAATFRGGSVAVMGSTGNTGGCEVRMEHMESRFASAESGSVFADERNKVSSCVVDLVLGGRHQSLGVREVDASGVADCTNNRPGAVGTVANVRKRGPARRGARRQAQWQLTGVIGNAVRNVGAVGGVDGIHSIQREVTTHTGRAANGVHVTEGEEGVADAVRDVFYAAHVAHAADLGAGANGTITNRAAGAGQIQRIGAVRIQRAAVTQVDTGFLGRRVWQVLLHLNAAEYIEFGGGHCARKRLAQDGEYGRGDGYAPQSGGERRIKILPAAQATIENFGRGDAIQVLEGDVAVSAKHAQSIGVARVIHEDDGLRTNLD